MQNSGAARGGREGAEERTAGDGGAERGGAAQSGGCGAEQSVAEREKLGPEDQDTNIFDVVYGGQSRREGQSCGERSRWYSHRSKQSEGRGGKANWRDDASALGRANHQAESEVRAL